MIIFLVPTTLTFFSKKFSTAIKYENVFLNEVEVILLIKINFSYQSNVKIYFKSNLGPYLQNFGLKHIFTFDC